MATGMDTGMGRESVGFLGSMLNIRLLNDVRAGDRMRVSSERQSASAARSKTKIAPAAREAATTNNPAVM